VKGELLLRGRIVLSSLESKRKIGYLSYRYTVVQRKARSLIKNMKFKGP